MLAAPGTAGGGGVGGTGLGTVAGGEPDEGAGEDPDDGAAVAETADGALIADGASPAGEAAAGAGVGDAVAEAGVDGVAEGAGDAADATVVLLLRFLSGDGSRVGGAPPSNSSPLPSPVAALSAIASKCAFGAALRLV